MFACLCGLVFLGLSVTSVTAIQQNEINLIAQNLKVQVDLGTNHEVGSQFDVTFSLTNTGRAKIFTDDDWYIVFNMKNPNLLTQPVFQEDGLVIMPGEGCSYKIQADSAGTNKKFAGLRSGDTAKIKITAEGLSLFKYDMFPRFYIAASKGSAKNIKSTIDNNLRFVKLSAANSTEYDLSRMTGLHRSLTQPVVTDIGRVPPTIVMPAPKSIEPKDGEWLDLSRSGIWHVWADKEVSQEFKDIFVEKLSSLPNVTSSMITFINREPGPYASRIYLQIKQDVLKTKDGYILAINPRKDKPHHLIHISATSDTGLHNALESLMSIAGLFNILPGLQINDDARFPTRSVQLDVTKNFIPAPVIKKLIQLMKMYKLNNLVLNLADNYGWRLQMPSWMKFDELVNYGSKRCADEKICLPPEFGSGAFSSGSGSGYYTINVFEDLLKYAKDMRVTITPKINLLGSIRSAKKASHRRYENYAKTDQAEANRLHLMSGEPVISDAQMAKDTCYKDGVLDPCNDATYEFIKDVVKAVSRIYKNAKVSLTEFHAGGDETTRYFSLFPKCKSKKVSQKDAMKRMLNSLNNEVAKYKAKLRVSEEAVTDPETKRCLKATKTYSISNLIVDFWNIMPGNQDDWGLSTDELKFINDPLPAPEAGGRNDPLQSFTDKFKNYTTWSKKGLAPWATAYSCANDGYKVVLSPESFFSLDSAYELDFDEIGNHKKDRFHIINLHHMQRFEPLNLHTNMDTGNDGMRFLPYRLCHIFTCEPLKKKENIIGLQATIDTEVIRTEEMLWHSITPQLLMFAERAWREAPFEGILKAEDPSTLMNATANEERAYYLNYEIANFYNGYGYKESGRLDFNKYGYRVSRPGAHIRFGLAEGSFGPYGVIVRVDFPGADIDYVEHTNWTGADAAGNKNLQWKPLFTRDANTGVMSGGYLFDFPTSDKTIEIRTRSTDGQRSSLSTFVRGGTKDLWPREIPIALRKGTCLPIRNAWETEINDLTQFQWSKIKSNFKAFNDDREGFRQSRERNITSAMRRAAEQRLINIPISRLNISEVSMRLQQLMMTNPNQLATLPNNDARKYLYNLDEQIAADRRRQLDARYASWEREYQNCIKRSGTGTRQQSRRIPGTGRTGLTGQLGNMPGESGQGTGKLGRGVPGQGGSAPGFGQPQMNSGQLAG